MDFALYWSLVMDAKFSILIIDDDEDFIDSLKGNIRDYLNEKYNLELEIESKGALSEGLEVLQTNSQIDLIIVDYNLENGEKGSNIIHNIGDISNRPVVFYSSQHHQELYKSINEIIKTDDNNNIESIKKRKLLLQTSMYILDKDEIRNGENYLDDIILRIENPEHLRGFTLSKASELENELYDLIKYLLIYISNIDNVLCTTLYNDIIKSVYNETKNKLKTFAKFIHKQIEDKSLNDDNQSIDINSINELFGNQDFRFSFHFDKRAFKLFNTLDKIKDKLSFDGTNNDCNYEDFKKNIIHVRNACAHRDDISNIDYKDFRQNYKKYRDFFKEITNLINNK